MPPVIRAEAGPREPDRTAAESEAPRWAAGEILFGALALTGVVVFAGVALLFALTVPYHEWDAYAFGEWSRRVANGAWDIGQMWPASAHRPLFYWLQGAVWSVTGVSHVGGRLLSLVFAVLFVGAVWALAREPGRRLGGVAGALAVIFLLAVPAFSAQAVAGLSDVPAAAMVAVTAAVAFGKPTSSVRRPVVLVVLGLLSVLTKPSTLTALAGIMAATAVGPRSSRRARIRRVLCPLAAGVALGLAYGAVMAARFDLGLVAFLRFGTTDFWAELAAEERLDTVLRLDVLGTGLRVPLACTLVYAAGRACGASNRLAGWIGLVVGLEYAFIGPYLAGGDGGPFSSTSATLAFVGFACLFVVLTACPDTMAPDRTHVVRLALVGVPPLLVWAYATPYADRLAATAWPGLVALIAVVLAPPSRLLAQTWRTRPVAFGLAGLLAILCWSSISVFDGFVPDQWREYRSLGARGVWDERRTLNIVLPAVGSTLETIAPVVGVDGRLYSTDPRFQFWLPGRVSTGAPTACPELKGYAGFVLITSDEFQAQLRAAGGDPDPAWWAACNGPRLEQLSDGSNGMVAYAVR